MCFAGGTQVASVARCYEIIATMISALKKLYQENTPKLPSHASAGSAKKEEDVDATADTQWAEVVYVQFWLVQLKKNSQPHVRSHTHTSILLIPALFLFFFLFQLDDLGLEWLNRRHWSQENQLCLCLL